MQPTLGETKSVGLSDAAAPTSETESLSLPTAEICVICLYQIVGKAACLPCQHDQFDFPCLGTWLQQNQTCPLCKATVTAVRHDADTSGGSAIFHLPADNALPQRAPSQISRRRHRQNYGGHIMHPQVERSLGLERRREVYRQQMYSLRVGSSRVSGYRNVGPGLIRAEPKLVTKTRIFVRRELRVFDFLNPESTTFGMVDRRATNAEFLLEYIVAIVKAIDIKGSTGQAEELLKDYLGRANARLFLHELEAWLRSPYERLEEWDRNVQYGEPMVAGDDIGVELECANTLQRREYLEPG